MDNSPQNWRRQLAPHPSTLACKNPMDEGAWWAAVHGVAKSRTRLSDFTLTFHFPALEKEMATHSSVLAWRIPGTGEPHGLTSMGSHRVGHDWSDLAAVAELWKFMIHIRLIAGLENFEHYFASMWDECNCAVVWTFFGFAFLWDWNENWPFPVLWPQVMGDLTSSWRQCLEMASLTYWGWSFFSFDV